METPSQALGACFPMAMKETFSLLHRSCSVCCAHCDEGLRLLNAKRSAIWNERLEEDDLLSVLNELICVFRLILIRII